MQTFFKRVLPATGSYCLLSGPSGGPDGKLFDPRHWNGIQTIADLERKAVELSTQPLNVFYAVGSYAGNGNRSAKTAIAKRAVFLDLDGKDFPSVEDAIKQLGLFIKATGLPPPSIYVHSGRGVHVYWCLDRDVSVAEWLPVATALKAKCTELGFAADPTVTADCARILRVPGTLNRKGVSPLPCRVLSDNGTTCSIGSIATALGSMPASRKAHLASLVSNDDLISKPNFKEKSVEQVIDMLEWIEISAGPSSRDEWISVLNGIQDWSKKSDEGFEIFHNWSSGQPKYVSREACWETWSGFYPGGGIGIGTLIRLAKAAGYVEQDQPEPVPDSASFSQQVSTPQPVSVSSVPAGPQVIAQVVSSPLMIAAAHAVAAYGKPRFDMNDAVKWLSNEFVTVTDQDGIFYSMTNKAPMTKTVIDDLLTRYMPLNGNGVPINTSALIRRYGTIYSVHTIGFNPGAPPIYMEDGLSYVNHYRNPPDMIQGTANEIALIDNFWDYCFPGEEDREFGQYMRQFYGHAVQHPALKIASAPLIISKEFGCGKTTLAFDIPKAFIGTHSTEYVSNKVLRSSFSDYLCGTHFLHFDEVHINGKWDSDDTANSMKTLITGQTIEIHPKGQKPYNLPNRLFITATSNYEDAITLPSSDERRWGVYYLRPARNYSAAQKEAYFGLLHRFRESARGPGVLRWYFNQIDLAGFNPQRAPPTTIAKRAMIGKSQAPETQILAAAFDDGIGPFTSDLGTIDSIRMYLHSETSKTYSSISASAFLRHAIPEVTKLKQVRSGQVFVRAWAWRDQAKWLAATPTDVAVALKS